MAAPTGSDAPNDAKPSSIHYEYMFEDDKRPTQQLDALLRAVAAHISRNIGDSCELSLTPTKLAAFYKAVGGDYDSLFIQRDHTAISFMWQVTGCQHHLIQDIHAEKPDYAPPTVPALTSTGFSRWESLEILLGPEEHVPFIQYAVKNWNLKHPGTGEDFPSDLPSNVFPTEPDAAVDSWHKKCAAKLWEEATSESQARTAESERERDRASSPEKPEPKFTYAHVKSHFYPSPPQTARGPDPRDSEHPRRPLYAHVPRHGNTHPGRPPMQPRSPERSRESPSGARDRGRRRSFSDYPSPIAQDEPTPNYNTAYADPKRRPEQPRRHSHAHISSETSEDEPITVVKPPRRRQQQSPPTPPYSRSRGPNASSQQSQSTAPRTHRSEVRESELKRRGGNSPLGSIRNRVSEKVSKVSNGLFPSNVRPYPDVVRPPLYNNPPRQQQRRNTQTRGPPSRQARVESDAESIEASDSESSEEESSKRRPPIRPRDERERDRYRERGRPYVLDREADDDMESAAARRTRQHLRRPDTFRRTSSHADVDRRREVLPQWDPRDKDRRDSRDRRDDRKRYERRSPDHDRDSSPLTGVSGRRYPEPQYA